jgi:hypothetical protein
MAWWRGGGKKTGRAAKRKSGRGGSVLDADKARSGLKVLAAVGLCLALVLGWRAAKRELSGYVAQRHAVTVQAEAVELVGLPAWLAGWQGGEAVSGLREAAAGPVSSDPLDGESLRASAAAVGGSAWVASVGQVQRLPGGGLRVEAVYRQPVAVVEGRDGYHLVDASGVKLPGLYALAEVRGLELTRDGQRRRLPTVRGMAAGPPFAGGVWAGDDVQAGLDLAELLSHQWYRDHVEAIDVSHRDGMGRLSLVVRMHGADVVWGLPPGREQAVEPEAAQKLALLSEVAWTFNGRSDVVGQVVHVNTGTVRTLVPGLGG